jgi:hypothetical protein
VLVKSEAASASNQPAPSRDKERLRGHHVDKSGTDELKKSKSWSNEAKGHRSFSPRSIATSRVSQWGSRASAPHSQLKLLLKAGVQWSLK